MGKIKKRRNAIIEAVSDLFKSADHRKKLKKAKAFEAFIDKLETRREALRDRLTGEPGKRDKRAIERQLEILDSQIPKAKKLLADMKAKERAEERQ